MNDMITARELKMKVLAMLIVTVLGGSAFAGIQPQIKNFLGGFPDKMSCEGIEVNYYGPTRKPLSQKVTIEFSNKLSDTPMIAVNAPSASTLANQQFRIGDGYGGRMEKLGRFSYEFLPDEKVLLYIRRTVGDEEPFDMVRYLAIRDSGALISFSEKRVCRNTFQCIELSSCVAIP